MKTRMKTLLTCVLLMAVVCGALALAACTLPSGNTSGATTGGVTPTAAATATPKPKPTAVPAVTLAFCQRVLSIAEANQIMQPTQPAATILVAQFANGGQCTYSSSPSLAGLVLVIRLETYTGTRPIPEQDIDTYFKQGLNQPGVIVGTNTPVSGMGDQAGIVVGSYTLHGTTTYGAAFYVLYGNIVFFCGNIYSSSPRSAQQSQLQQCAQLVVSRL